jgi:hypothetical protein
MSDDDILAIVAALEFVTLRDEAPPPKSRWKIASREFEDDEPASSWKNS